MTMRKLAAGAAVGLLAMAATTPALAQYGMDKKKPATTPELPKCAQAVGTVAIEAPARDWWTPMGLGNPESLLKLYAMRSGCLRVVSRGSTLAMRDQERALQDSGEMRRNSQMGKGQLVGADYVLTPDIAGQDSNAGGMGAAAGVLGRAFGGTAGALIGGISTKRSEAHVVISLTNTRTTEQEYVAEGTAQKTDIGFGLGGFAGSGGAAGGGYSNTEIGKVVSAAYLNAFVDLIGHMQRTAPGTAQAAAGPQAYTVTAATAMRAGSNNQAKAVRTFKAGDLVYPTGQKSGVWWEVDDETGNRGWVTSPMLTPR